MSFSIRRKTGVTGLLFFICFTTLAQKPEDILQGLSERSPIEKVYLHFDRDNYMAGETAWFKAYLFSDFLPDTISTSLYVELLNDSSVIVSRKILPVFLGNSNSQFELPDSLKTGYYFIRAYSPSIFTRDPDFICQQNLFIYGKKNSNAAVLEKPKALRLEFFPEGGNFITGSINTVAFKATNENGLPVTISGNIKNEKDEVLAPFTVFHDGMGMFDLNPLANEKYYAVLNDDATGHKYYLPGQTDKGIVFKVISTGRKKYFELLQQINNPSFKAAYMIGQMQHHIVFRQDFSQGRQEITGTIDVSHLNSGILQVTVFNKDNIPLAERLTFVNNEEYVQKAELLADTLNFSEKGKNTFHVFLKDTVQGFFSVAVTDPEYDLDATRRQNIISTLLLTSDLKGYIHNPAYYFSETSDSVQNALDLVMMINGWRRFKWSSLLNNNLPAAVNKDEGYITITGHLYIKDTKKPFANKPFIIFVYSPDSSRMMRMLTTDAHGYFKIDSLLFFDKTRLLFKDIRGKKSDLLEVKLSDDSLARNFQIARVDKQNFYRHIMGESQEKKLAFDYDAILKAEGKMLAGVTVKAKKKNPVEELEEKYVSGLFSGFSERIIDLVNTTDMITQENILEYLSYKVPGLNITRDGLDYYIYYRQIANLSSMGLIPMTLYLDEIETDASSISSIPANQVAMVKVFNSFVGAVGNGAGGVLAVYTKKGTDLYNSASTTDIVRYQGYSVIKEFYSPDYSVDSASIKKQDKRITLFWAPQFVVSSINGNIPVTFYNNDRSKQFKIVVEGMTVDGKLLMIEKTFGRKPF
jgi:hypothetical protein